MLWEQCLRRFYCVFFKRDIKGNVHMSPKKPWEKITFHMTAMSRYSIIGIPARKMDSN